ncbi:MAG: NAD(P)/FAD-dependent oxidoreductase [Acidobacteriaceae bacterium]|nr:NAD(P)/FAD-dependent oxidoreductase [Acidobacteriaceae bacterium]
MDFCDVLIAGGGPAGSSCAWALRHSGLHVVVLDKQNFPRDKICGGWITPEVLTALKIEPDSYASHGVLQPITAFKTGCIGRHSPAATDYGTPVSYGVRRCEFDYYLLKRCDARIRYGVSVNTIERSGKDWVVNGDIRARLLVGAGGHFCPVARKLTRAIAAPVVAQETEFEMDSEQQTRCPVGGTVPELYFCPDLKGYGWCFRKGKFLNVGLGRLDPHELPAHVDQFLKFLSARNAFFHQVPRLRGHAYLLYGTSPRPFAGDGFLLVGDSAGLAYPQSGEGILPAIESGLMASEVILSARGDYSPTRLEAYARKLAHRFGHTSGSWAMRAARHLPAHTLRFAARQLILRPRLARSIVLDRWFLHR